MHSYSVPAKYFVSPFATGVATPPAPNVRWFLRDNGYEILKIEKSRKSVVLSLRRDDEEISRSGRLMDEVIVEISTEES